MGNKPSATEKSVGPVKDAAELAARAAAAQPKLAALSQLEIDRTAQKNANLSLKIARENLRVLEEVESPRQQLELNHRIERLEKQIQFLHMQSKTSHDQLTSQIETRSAVLTLETARLHAIKTIPTSLSIRASVSGIVHTLKFPNSIMTLKASPTIFLV